MRRTMISFAVAALALSGCGGGDDDTAAAEPPAATTADNADDGTSPSTDAPDDDTSPSTDAPDDGTDDTAAPSDDVATDSPPSSGLAENTAVVTIGDERYEFDVTPTAVQRCDPNFFGAFWVLGKDADNNSVEMLIPPEGDPNFEESPSVSVGDKVRDIEWRADPDHEMAGVDPGESQVDSSTVDGTHLTGTATFVDLNATYAFQGGVGDEPEPVTGTFEVLCADG